MRKLVFFLMLFPVIVFAQSQQGMPPGMQQRDMEQMQRRMQQMDMGKMQEAAACMKNIDRSALEGLEEEGKKMEAEVGALCKSGKRDEAQDKAMEYAKEMMSRPELMKMRECGKMMAGMLPEMPFENLEEEGKKHHVCDDF